MLLLKKKKKTINMEIFFFLLEHHINWVFTWWTAEKGKTQQTLFISQKWIHVLEIKVQFFKKVHMKV